MKRFSTLIIILGLVVSAALLKPYLWGDTTKMHSEKTISDRLKEYGAQARARLAPYFKKAKIHYPPDQLVFVGIKSQNRLQVYAKANQSGYKFIREYPILKASGVLGPKLREGDLQVPEGIYPIELLNPNSRFHLSLRIGYPNQFDREQAQREGRTNLGGDIMIHGSNVSIGCLAMGDEAAEDLFVLAADTGIRNITVILTPVDFRKNEKIPASVLLPEWTRPLYEEIKLRLNDLRDGNQ